MIGPCYLVELTRRVQGSAECRRSTLSKRFPFGATKEFGTGARARQAAEAFANANMAQANEVSLWRLTVLGQGLGDYLKQDAKKGFDSPWPDGAHGGTVRNHG